MLYPPHFYVEKAGKVHTWKRLSPGTLSVGRLINGEAAWSSGSWGVIKEKRPLVCNILSKSLPREAVIEKLILLIRDGFEVYALMEEDEAPAPSDENHVKERTAPRLTRLTEEILQTRPDALRLNLGGVDVPQSLRNRPLPRERQAHCLTHFDMERLVKNNPRLTVRHLEIEDLDDGWFTREKWKPVSRPNQVYFSVPYDPEPRSTGFKTTRIHWSEVIASKDYSWKNFIRIIDTHYVHTATPKSLIIDNKNVWKLLNDMRISHPFVQIQTDDLKSVTHLQCLLTAAARWALSHCQSPQPPAEDIYCRLDALLLHTPALEVLNMCAGPETGDWPMLPRLREVYCTVDKEQALIALLEKNPHIQSLSLNVDYHAPVITDPVPTLPGLETLSLDFSYFTGKLPAGWLERWEKSAPHLKKLTLCLNASNHLQLAEILTCFRRIKALYCDYLLPLTSENAMQMSELARSLKSCTELRHVQLDANDEMRRWHISFPSDFYQSFIDNVPNLDEGCRQDLQKRFESAKENETKWQIASRAHAELDFQDFLKSMNLSEIGAAFRELLKSVSMDDVLKALAESRSDSNENEIHDAFKGVNLKDFFNAIGGLETLKILGTNGVRALKESGLLGEIASFKTLKQFLFAPPAYSAPAASSNAEAERLTLPEFSLDVMRDHLPEAVKALSTLPLGTKNLNSEMLEARLGQFLKLQAASDANIAVPSLAEVLPEIASELGPVGIQKMLQFFSEWDGERKTLTDPHINWFNRLKARAEGRPGIRHYAGAGIFDSLQHLDSACILSTPWRAITIFPLKEGNGTGKFLIFDPRFSKGQFRADADELPEILGRILGSPHLICTDRMLQEPAPLANIDDVIAGGGLLALQQASDGEAFLQRLTEAPPLAPPSDKAIQSLFLRHPDGRPMFLAALQSGSESQMAITLYLLNGLMQKNPRTYWKLLQKSIPDLHPSVNFMEVIQGLNLACQHFSLHPWVQSGSHLSELPLLEEALNNAESDREALINRRKKEKHYDSPEEFFSDLFQKEDSFRLAMPDGNTIDAFCLDFMAYVKGRGRDVIFIDKPEALQCANPFIRRQEDEHRGLFAEGPGGALHHALQNHDNPPLIVLNSQNFLPQDLVRFNTLLDIPASSDGTPLPPKTGVILLENTKDRARHQGGEFYSRIKRWMDWPFAPAVNAFPPLPSEPLPESTPAAAVDVFNARDWKELLLGRWQPLGREFSWVEGKLVRALQSVLPVVLYNPPLHDREFMRTLHEARIKGFFEHEGQHIPWPDGGFSFEEGYRWNEAAGHIASWRIGLSPEAKTLNSFYFSQLEERYRCADGLAFAIDGWVAEHKNGLLTLNISHPLEESQWARLLALCAENEVQLSLNLADESLLPAGLRQACEDAAPPLPPEEPHLHTRLIKSDDPDVTRLQPEWANAHCVDISECDPSQLLDALDGVCDRKAGTMRFWETRGLLPQLLEQHETVILRGRFSPEHLEALMPFLLERVTKNPDNRLILLPDNPEQVAFPDFNEERHTIPREAVWAHLQHPEHLPERARHTEPLSRLRVREQFLAQHPQGDSDLAWEGLEFLETRLVMELPDFAKSHENAAAFERARIDALWSHLRDAPMVFMAGLTGVGKSTLMETTIAEGGACTLWHTAGNMQTWARDRQPGLKLLFIDEANTSAGDWSAFEGIFETPPHVRIDNVCIEITSEHKVVFAGNPASYGDTRKIASLFARHGNVLVVEPMPCDYLYENILKPLFAANGISREDTEAACLEILRMYVFLCEHSKDRVLISPRELEMMALLSLSNRSETISLTETTRHFARIIGKNLVTGKLRLAFEAAFPESGLQRLPTVHGMPEAASSMQPSENTRTYCFTPSRDPAVRLLEDLLALREQRRILAQKGHPLPRTLLYGGLGGIVLEGPPGVGKSEMVKALLERFGYARHSSDRGFYTLPASLNIEAKKRRLLKAFEEGAVVYIDEINACERLEDFLNDLLMGKNPLTKKPPKHPGFMLIGTQNPLSDGARQQASNALMRRLITVEMPEYPPDEMITLLVHEGLDPPRAKMLVSMAEVHNCAPYLPPSARITFRDLLKHAQKILGRAKLKPIRPDEDDDEEEALLDEALPRPLPTMFMPRAPLPTQRFETRQQSELWGAVFNAISNLRLYGAELRDNGADDAVKASGSVACGIADTLETEAGKLRNNYDPDGLDNVLKNIEQHHESMGTHRHPWLPLLFTVLKLLNDAMRAIIGLAFNPRFFTVDTERQKRLREVHSALIRLERYGEPYTHPDETSSAKEDDEDFQPEGPSPSH
ncbi:AAA domain (dynein-related subfamily) [Legionella geestiana]|uniref:AAA domain (Dynein-related subfamily) n=1 Tax=Legionella geestiana TaxID=45065 RepID=A0A0W0U4T5_9GAMM|nr:AAA family ATPase [Legionella geestiana]KTD03044.1 AAA domain (dynein-related subfamily) [Legionella geestiana]QBS12303.1 hypothetical protein E4T54_05835 [Legionella geestiana]STX52955.1 AAA domain (dynein-related subfamily) [Legionella geestiana]